MAATSAQASGAERIPRSRAPRARTLLFLFAAVPVLVGGVVGIGEIGSSRAEATLAEGIERRSGELVLLTELSAAIIDERNWNSALEGIATVGLTSAMLEPFTGIDLAGEFESSQAEVDRLLDLADRPDLTERIATARSQNAPDDVEGIDGLATITTRYDQLEIDIEQEGEQLLDQLLTEAGRTRGGDELVTALRVLERAADARHSVAQLATSYFGAQFGAVSSVDGENGYLVLIEEQSALDRARDDMRRIAATEAAARARLGVVENDDQVVAFEQAVAALIATRLELGAEAGAVDLGGLLADVEQVSSIFQAGNASSAAHLEVVSASGDDVRAAAEAMRASSNQHALMVAAMVIGGVLLTTAATALLLTSIARPLRELANAAVWIRDGRTDRRVRPFGPLETREAASALNEAAASLQAFQHHTRAIADGKVPDVEMGPAPIGALGATVTAAVETLAESISQQESFRTRLAYEASHDSLTQISNRRASLERIRSALQTRDGTSRAVALLFVDLDGFKAVNDDLGHRAGDMVLRQTAERMRSCVRAEDHIGRLGGDEFVIVLEGADNVARADRLAARLIEALSEPIQLDIAAVSVEASIGIAVDDHRNSTPESLLHEADLAVYEAKRRGRSSICRCDDELRARALAESNLETEIRAAIDDDQFELWHQPLVDATTGAITGCEALLRWHHPDRGLTAPAGFVLFAERSDLILDIDRWVLERAAQDLADDPTLMSLSVNVSSRHVASTHFVDDILDPCRRHEIDPSRLIVEVTESAVLDDLEGAAAKLSELRSFGIRIALDDFGTGYASLSHLRELPLDIVKVDRSFTHDVHARALARLIVETGQLLELSVTAEGVETAEQADALVEMGVDVLQGYHFGRPAPAASIRQLRSAPTAL